jgi:hypothetical protein
MGGGGRKWCAQGGEWFDHLKGLSYEIFGPVFLGRMDVSRPECELLVVLKYCIMMLL